MKIKTLRRLLGKNKIFIDLFSSIGLTVIAIIIAYGAYKNDKQELLINELEHSPRIVMEQWYYEDGDGKRIREGLSILNEGYYVSNFKQAFYTFIKIDKRDNKLNLKSSVIIPIKGYIGVGSLYNNSKGELASFFIKNSLFNELQYQFAIEANTDDEFVYELEKLLLLKVDYRDYKNDSMTKYYSYDNFNRGSEISEDKAKEIIAFDNEKDNVYLDEIAPSDIINFINHNELINDVF